MISLLNKNVQFVTQSSNIASCANTLNEYSKRVPILVFQRRRDETRKRYEIGLQRCLDCPKRSTLRSRREVTLERTYTFRHSKQTWTGVPIMAANMDGVGTFGIHNALAEHKLFTCLVKHYDHTDWENQNTFNPNYLAISTGTGQADWERCQELIPKYNLSWICIDIANGYS